MDQAFLKSIDQTVGRKIREARQSCGLSQGKLAEALGVTFQQVQKYESGKNRVSASRLYHIAHILDYPVSFFFEEPEKGWPEKPGKEFLRWMALYKELPPGIRSNYLNMAWEMAQTLKGGREN